VKEALEWAARILKEKNLETPVKEAGVLLAFVLSREISWLYAHPMETLGAVQQERFGECVRQRAGGMPFQYISGRQEFMSLDFVVDPNCLIPRADTETLVEAALAWMQEHPAQPMRVLDIGTGSGAIAVSVARYSDNARVDAMDLSAGALRIAEENARRHQVMDRIYFFKTDFLVWQPESRYSVVLSNPPYIPRGDLKDLMPGVRDYEPHLALDGGEDGLLFYRAIAHKAKTLLLPGGALFTEVGIHQAGEVSRLYEDQGLKVRIYKDLAGIDRVICAERSGKIS
jgi:release factor glutamine methyltransferase